MKRGYTINYEGQQKWIDMKILTYSPRGNVLCEQIQGTVNPIEFAIEDLTKKRYYLSSRRCDNPKLTNFKSTLKQTDD